ncbi:site-specific tyrosine recombinase/integron integrase [Saccharicrinis sp. FJH54]|uniref:site-specific tyrosine recombinase/integron integrase n=1 Tax=Saccharicrinis sp. FJH54 TaxID=3344665 RepID=UPI0035D40200
MTKPIIKLERARHRDIDVVFIRFEYNPGVAALLKPLGATYTKTHQCWYIPRAVFNFEDFTAKLRNLVEITYDEKNKTKTPAQTDKTYKYEVTLEHNRSDRVIYIRFYYNESLVDDIKHIIGAWYHPGAKTWSVPDTEESMEALHLIMPESKFRVIEKTETKSFAKIQKFKSKPEQNLVPERYIDQLVLQNKSKRTIEIYESFINQFLNRFSDTEPDNIPMDSIRDYILDHRQHQGYSVSYQNQMVSALKSFYRIMYQRNLMDQDIPRPKKGRQLPKVISKEEVERLIGATNNLKHRLILLLLYGCGLRLNELLMLKVTDINLNNNILWVRKGKGSKDRRLPLPGRIKQTLEQYIKSYLPRELLLDGYNGEKYAPSSVQNIVKRCAQRAGIEKRITPHVLRHCYATHMLEKGVDLRYIQELLGHKSSKTTEIYTYVSNRKLGELGNPLDDIKF